MTNLALAKLQSLSLRGSLPHAWLFIGPENSDKLQVAREFSQWLLCSNQHAGQACGLCKQCNLFISASHPDFYQLTPQDGESAIVVEDVRTLNDFLAGKPQFSAKKIVLLYPAEKMNRHAANALLKNLEEPGANTLLILLTTHADLLLTTIVSRCQRLNFAETTIDQTGVEAVQAQELIADLAKLFVTKAVTPLQLVDKWIYSRLNETIQTLNNKLESHTLDEGAKAVYEFLRGDFCDWYVEIAKSRLYNSDDVVAKKTAQYVLWNILEQGLKLLHPFMPFLTEEIWQKLGAEGETIMLSEFPKFDQTKVDTVSENAFIYVQELVSAIRNIRAEMNVSPAKAIHLVLKSVDEIELETLEANKGFLCSLAKVEKLEFGKDIVKPEGAGFRVAGKTEVYVPLADLLDVEAEIAKKHAELLALAYKLESFTWKHRLYTKLKDSHYELLNDSINAFYGCWSESSEGCD